MSVDSLDDIAHPGTLFKWGSHRFMNDGVSGDTMNVVRLSDYGSRDELPLDQLEDAIESGTVQLLQTYTEDKVAVPEDELSTVLAFLADDPALDGHKPEDSEVAEAMLAVELTVHESSHWFRYRDE